MGLEKREWHGDRLKRLGNASSEQAAVEMAEALVEGMKAVVHIESSALHDDIHYAKPGTSGEVTGAETRRATGGRYPYEVGSWLPYACVENNRGGPHRFADIGWELTRSMFMPILRERWKAQPGL